MVISLLDVPHESPTHTSSAYFDHDITALIPLVDRILRYIARHLPKHVELADLRSVGILGLMHSFQRYNECQADTFEAYARMRIKGAILDELRRMDSLPRSSRSKARALRSSCQELEQRLGRVPTDAEIYTEMGMAPDAYERLLRQTQEINLVSLDQPPSEADSVTVSLHDTLPDDRQKPGYDSLQREETSTLLSYHLDRLPERHRRLISMLYFEDKHLGEVAETLGVTEARVCQLRTQALERLRSAVSSDIH